jgi:hypothetical protein
MVRSLDATAGHGDLMTETTWCARAAAHAAWLSVMLVAGACGGSASHGLGSTDGGGSTGPGDSGGAAFGNSSGVLSNSGSGSGGTGSAGGMSSTCIVGSRGCLCDSMGACAPGLTCAPQGGSSSVCCSGSNCAPSSGSIGATCGSSSGGAACTPGITALSGSGDNDGCGYPSADFNESSVLCGINAIGGGSSPAIIQVFYSDEHALTLGCATSADPVSTLPADPGAAAYPETGDPACVDAVGRPLRPVLYVTDITSDSMCTAGDLQHGGTPYGPIAVFGTWKSASEGSGGVGTPGADPTTANGWDLGAGADSVSSAIEACGQMAGGMPGPAGPGGAMDGGPGGPGGGPAGPGGGPGPGGGNYGTELRFEVGLVSGHSYRFQVIVHDGDQNKGGDSGEACVVYCAGGPSCGEGSQPCGTADAAACPEGNSCVDGCCMPPTVLSGQSDSGATTPPP